jgi:hypothetical protein
MSYVFASHIYLKSLELEDDMDNISIRYLFFTSCYC